MISLVVLQRFATSSRCQLGTELLWMCARRTVYRLVAGKIAVFCSSAVNNVDAC